MNNESRPEQHFLNFLMKKHPTSLATVQNVVDQPCWSVAGWTRHESNLYFDAHLAKVHGSLNHVPFSSQNDIINSYVPLGIPPLGIPTGREYRSDRCIRRWAIHVGWPKEADRGRTAYWMH